MTDGQATQLSVEHEGEAPRFMEVRTGDTLVIVRDYAMSDAEVARATASLEEAIPEGVTVLLLDRVSQTFVVRGAR